MTQSLDARLLDAHASKDRTALVSLYVEAANGASDHTAQCFYLTHAYVFALESGDKRVRAIRDQLIALGAEPAGAG